MRFDTRAIHAGRDDLSSAGVHATPLDLSTTYPSHDVDGEAHRLELLHPLAGYLLLRGLSTLPVRVRRAAATAADLAGRWRPMRASSGSSIPGS